jgi:hypothetical protein
LYPEIEIGFQLGISWCHQANMSVTTRMAGRSG